MLTLFLFFILFQLSLASTNLRIDGIPPETVSSVDLLAYSGRWYQMYASLIPNITFEHNGYCVKADYTYIDSTQLDIVNSQRLGSASGKLVSIHGTATVVNSDDPGKLRVVFDNEMQQKYIDGIDDASAYWKKSGAYWIIALGPISSTTNKYEWAIVSTPFRLQLYILARDIDEFRTKYKTEVLDYVKNHGFNTFVNEPIETFQDVSMCGY